MLRMIKDDVKKNYYDPSFKGIDLEANYTVAVEKMGKAQSFGQMRHDVPAQRRGCGLIAFLTTK